LAPLGHDDGDLLDHLSGNGNQEDEMTARWLPPSAFVALFFALASPSWAASAAAVPSLTAEADGEVLVDPDLVVATLGVVSQAANVSAALSSSNADMTRVMAAIKAAGVANSDVATGDFSIRPRYTDASRNATARIDGFEVSNLMTVKIHDVQHAGTVIDQVLAAGANRVSDIAFTLADPSAANDRAVTAAITEARRKAQLTADAAGVKLGRVLSVSTNNQALGPRMAPAAFAEAASVPLAAGQRSITAHATIVWEIAPQ
jgi:uncharacterized protein YggE